MTIAPPKWTLEHPDRAVDCQCALEPAFNAFAERAEAAGTPNYELVDIALAYEECGIDGATPAEREFLKLVDAAERAGWFPEDVASALVRIAVARCQAALANADTAAIIERAWLRQMH